MLSFRLDGHNLPHKNPNIAAPKTTYSLTNPGALGRFTGVGNFSNFESHTPRVLSAFHSDFDFVMECGKVIWERR